MSGFKKISKKDHAFLKDLEWLLHTRKDNMPSGSYTTTMFKKGVDKIAQKMGEEAVEMVIASKNESDKEFREEAADLFFHYLMLLVEKDIPLHDIIKILKKRYNKGNHKHIGE